MALGWKGQYLRYREYFLNISSLYRKRADIRMFLEVILSLSTIIIFLAFALKPTVITIIGLVKEINARTSTVATLNQKIENLTSARKIYGEQADGIQLSEQSVPSSPNIDGLVGQIQGIAQKNAVKLVGFSVSDVSLKGDLLVKKTSELEALPLGAKELPVGISITSSNYQGLYSFLTDLENFRRPIKIDSVDIKSSVTSSGSSIVSVISGRIPYIGN